MHEDKKKDRWGFDTIIIEIEKKNRPNTESCVSPRILFILNESESKKSVK